MARYTPLPHQSLQLTGTKPVSVRKLLASRKFVDGFNDARSGKPFIYEHDGTGEEWSYERGRQLAIIYGGDLIKDGRRVTRAALHAYIGARMAGEII